ncbi:hypothetical protein OZY43_07925 [Lactobacillus sp. ESL0785]|uniref:hypothetical protein n=1 Tax=Lactobacillus sp. ESL0785 TaxID=2983232 RepID=UPI0023F7F4C9|nr:hypothetical protein [Lactobacillus sp. ESL0785]WEV70853.1 hypothetical protein OZY43_07925 [Lactobacillus sp. ESL0785]
MNKIAKILGISVATLGLAGGTFTNQVSAKAHVINPKKAVKNSQYGLTTPFTFTKSLQGKWYSNNNLTPDPLVINKTTFINPHTGKQIKAVIAGKVNGTNKYLWQMSNKWQSKHAKVFKNVARDSFKVMDNIKWTIISPVNEKTTANGYAFTEKDEKINDQTTIKVVFEANPTNGKVYNQYFTSKDAADKYSAVHFKDVTYTDINWK